MPGDRYEQSTQSWLGQYGASGLPGSNLPTLAGSRLCVAAGGSRVDARLVCGMTLVVTVHEVAGRYLAGGWWIRRESGMERRAHRLAAIVKGLLDLVPFEQLHNAIIFPRAILPTPEGRR